MVSPSHCAVAVATGHLGSRWWPVPRSPRTLGCPPALQELLLFSYDSSRLTPLTERERERCAEGEEASVSRLHHGSRRRLFRCLFFLLPTRDFNLCSLQEWPSSLPSPRLSSAPGRRWMTTRKTPTTKNPCTLGKLTPSLRAQVQML